MTATCPNGHLSTAEDYCDTCGTPIVAGAQAPTQEADVAAVEDSSEAAGAPTPEGEAAQGLESKGADHTCPNCQTDNVEGALFCEACGYDFTTGAMPRGAEPAAAASAVGATTVPGVTTVPGDTTAPGTAAEPGETAPTFEWVAEIWVDPDWYRTQEAEDPCPSPGLPTIVPLRRKSVLLGRVSVSRNTHPEIELSSDPGVSRRHAQLTTDGTRWFVEDLGSSNGTFVGPASGILPEQPISVGPRTELSDDDRLYVGAWTRVVVRRATPEEVDTYA